MTDNLIKKRLKTRVSKKIALAIACANAQRKNKKISGKIFLLMFFKIQLNTLLIF